MHATEGLRGAVVARLDRFYRTRIMPWRRRSGFRESGRAESRRLHAMRLRHLRPVEQPLVVISQAQRSGGTLLSQLFAGHPECHVHPGELYIGYPKKFIWPRLDLRDRPEDWFHLLFGKRVPEHAREGYVKVPPKLRASYDASEIYFPFLFSPRLQREIFRRCVAGKQIRSQRDVLDCYFTSFFNAWLDYQGIYDARKEYVVGFVPRLSLVEESVEGYFRDYPEGRLISVLRDPKSWYVSYRSKKSQRAETPRQAILLWKKSAETMLANRRRFGDRVHLIRFDSLLLDTETAMRDLCRTLGIGFDEILLRPTFQHTDIRANSAFRVDSSGVLDGPADRSGQLAEGESDWIQRETRELYEAVLKETDRRRGKH